MKNAPGTTKAQRKPTVSAPSGADTVQLPSPSPGHELDATRLPSPEIRYRVAARRAGVLLFTVRCACAFIAGMRRALCARAFTGPLRA